MIQWSQAIATGSNAVLRPGRPVGAGLINDRKQIQGVVK